MHDKAIKIIEQIRKKVSSIEGVVALIILANFFLYLTLLIYSHQNFFTFNEGDKGIMYQMYYNTVIHGDIFYSSIQGGSALYNRYILVLFLPFMYLYPNIPVTFSVISTALLSLGALPVYWLATDVAKSKRIGLLFVGLYFLYPSLGWLMLESVKEEIFVLPFLLFAFYYMHVKSYPKSMLFLFLAVICKQNMLLVLPMFAIYAFLENYDKKWIAGPVAISVGWFISLQFILRPYFSSLAMGLSGSPANFADPGSSSGTALTASLPSFSSFTAGRYGWMGSTFSEVFINLITNPFLFIQHLITPENILYLLLLFIPLCGISLLKPRILLLGLPIFLQNLLSTSGFQKMVTWHYVSVLVFVVICSAIYAFPVICEKIPKGKGKRHLFIVLLLLVALSTSVYLGPAPDTTNHLFRLQSPDHHYQGDFSTLSIASQDMDSFNRALKSIPNNTSISCGENFGAYLYNHRYISPYNSLSDKYDYHLVKLSTLKSYSDYRSLRDLIQDEERNIMYHDSECIIIGKGDTLQHIEKETALNWALFRSNDDVGQLGYDEASRSYVYYSSRVYNNPGHLIFGPYITLPEGEYIIEYIIRAENPLDPKEKIATLEVTSNHISTDNYHYQNFQRQTFGIFESSRLNTIDKTRHVYVTDLSEDNYQSINLTVSINDTDNPVGHPIRLMEFSVLQYGNSDLYVKQINVHRTDQDR